MTDGRPTANRVEPNKRPRSAMAPTIVLNTDDDSLKMLTGSSGGSSIIGHIAQSVWNVLEFGLDAQEAINVPHYQNQNGNTELEEPIDGITLDYNVEGLKDALEDDYGHDVSIGQISSGLAVIVVDGDNLVGGADPRRDGIVA
eukprot:CAMPEP_0118678998 /NCGR_PEP_ID=MMETSP0800-20121206/3538_1 /TAXON_ID=210618 ORGANISM="Striatella unipunctata, Strain CCMP2910" /NCGR_SAMPLE_ID=MMETSP0800 /ASSEMBLY_ACC=CAM_ASM_000638 /LENGTH=142 /DNA_ID=CAMNT_0006574933 /DNA_START=40 /DNA_END=468 /DNA_ORIENTATION=+